MQRSKFLAAGMVLAVLAAFGVGLYTGVANRDSVAASALVLNPDQEPVNADLKPLWTAWNVLEQNFVDTTASTTLPTDIEKVYGAIDGLTKSYNDPYTVFMAPVEAKQFQDDIRGEFGGVGMELGMREGVLTVVAPLKNSPAERAGILSGDLVLAVDGKSTDGMSVEEAVTLIRGEVGTTVTLLMGRKGETKPFEVSIIRDTIQVPVINTVPRADGIYEIAVYSFSANSTELFRQSLRSFIESGSKKLLLDLRGNPGGYLQAAVVMSSFFLPVGEVVVTEDFEGKADNIVHRSIGYNVFAKRPLQMAILVDQGSASASEILAGALKEHGVAKLVGTRTFGKGSVQELVDLGGGAQLKITIAKWLTPKGTSISDGGLRPDIEIERTVEDMKAGKDPQKDAAVAWLLGQ